MLYAFEEMELSTKTQELRRGGELIHIEPQVFSLLQYLLENSDRLISREELVETIWHGRFVSDAAISSCIRSARRALGDDGSLQRCIRTVRNRGIRFVAPNNAREEVCLETEHQKTRSDASQIGVPDVRFCKSDDGTRIAFSCAGNGPPVIKAANWLNHLEVDWTSPIWSHLFATLQGSGRLFRYDSRGSGMSDWAVSDLALERQVEDLEAVVRAADVREFALFGMSQGCAVCIEYAARYPERVNKLVLQGGYSRGWRIDQSRRVIEEIEALMTLIRTGWGKPNDQFRNLFTSLLMPDAPSELQTLFNNSQALSSTGENAARLLNAIGSIDVSARLEKVRAPTLVLHSRGDLRVPLGAGKELAAGIPNSMLITLNSKNHVIPHTDPAWSVCSAAIHSFLSE